MQSDFYNAFQRHWNDAEYLYTISRWANADQLYAYSAECGLKYLMLQFGMHVDPSGTPQMQDDKVHIDKIWGRYEAYRAGKVAAKYMLPQPNPFDNWHISNRYAHESNFSQADVDVHKDGTEIIRRLIRQTISEGWATI